jgi:hypothetical protein
MGSEFYERVAQIDRVWRRSRIAMHLAGFVIANRFIMTPHTRITTPFNRDSTATEALAGRDLTGSRVIHLDGNGRTPSVPRTSLQRAAATLVLLATSPHLAGVGGCYFEACNEAERVTRRGEGLHGVAPYALNPENADRLWDESIDMLAD